MLPNIYPQDRRRQKQPLKAYSRCDSGVAADLAIGRVIATYDSRGALVRFDVKSCLN